MKKEVKKKVIKKSVKETKLSTEDAIWSSVGARSAYLSSFIPEIVNSIKNNTIAFKFLEDSAVQQGEIIAVPKIDNIPAVVIQEDGKTTEIVSDGERVFIPEYSNTVKTRISLADIAMKQYDIISRIKDKVIYGIGKKIEDNFISMIETCVKYHKHIIKFNWYRKIIAIFKKGYFLDFLEKTLVDINKDCYTHGSMLISKHMLPKFQNLLYKYGSGSAVTDFKSGKLFGLDIITYTNTLNEVYGLAVGGVGDSIYIFPKEKIGWVKTRIDLTLLPADEFIAGIPYYGQLWYQQEGMCIIATDSIYKLEI